MVRLMTRRQMLRMKFETTAAWWLDDDNSHRQPILAVWCLAIPVIAGQAFLWFNTPWSTFARLGASLLTGGVVLGLAVAASFIIREDS